MESKIYKTPEGGSTITTTFSGHELAMVDRQIWTEVVDKVSTVLADKIIAEKGQDIIASIPLETILNKSVAQVVVNMSK